MSYFHLLGNSCYLSSYRLFRSGCGHNVVFSSYRCHYHQVWILRILFSLVSKLQEIRNQKKKRTKMNGIRRNRRFPSQSWMWEIALLCKTGITGSWTPASLRKDTECVLGKNPLCLRSCFAKRRQISYANSEANGLSSQALKSFVSHFLWWCCELYYFWVYN